MNKYLEANCWEEIVKYLFSIENNDVILSRHIAHEISVLCVDGKDRYYHLDHSIKNVLSHILPGYYSVLWPIFAAVILEKENSSYHLEKIFEPDVHLSMGRTGMITFIPQEYLYEWCDSEEKAVLLSKCVPVYDTFDNKLSLSKLTKFLIDSFGDSKKVRINVYRNLTPNGWSGSIIPYYKQAVNVLTQLLDHPSIQVRQWTSEVIAYFEESVKKEKQREDEHD